MNAWNPTFVLCEVANDVEVVGGTSLFQEIWTSTGLHGVCAQLRIGGGARFAVS